MHVLTETQLPYKLGGVSIDAWVVFGELYVLLIRHHIPCFFEGHTAADR